MKFQMSLALNSLNATRRFGYWLGERLAPGMLVLLSGEMGSGKTTLIKSICQAQGISPENVTSPTYTMVNIYRATWPIFHVDLYRLSSTEDLENFDREDLITEEGVTLIEWPALLLPLLSDEPTLHLSFETTGEEARLVKLEADHMVFQELFREFAAESF